MPGENATTVEPGAGLLRRPLWLLFLATRPAFLTLTAVGVVLGWASAWHGHRHLAVLPALYTMIFALLAHAGANVINDFYDRESDACNHDRLYPFTGGSRFIQNGLLTPRATAWFGYSLLLSVVPGGLWLLGHSAPGLLPIGILGLALAWAYSSPPLRLSAHGLGELSVAGGWSLVVVGSDYVLRQQFDRTPVFSGIAFGLLVAAVLYINQFPDAHADAATGKRTLVARLGARPAATGYSVILVAAVAVTLAGVCTRALNAGACFALLALLPASAFRRRLVAHVNSAADLRPAIKGTILMAHVFGILLALALLVG